MRFQALQVQAFRRVRSPYTIPLDRQGLVFVQGENRDWGDAAESNAASKSLVLRETFLWGLYGKMSRYGEQAITVEACHPQHGAHVRIIGDRFVFDRQRNAKGGDPRFVILDAETGLPARIARDPNRKVDDTTAALGFDYRAACAALVLSDDGVPFLGARFADQMETLESILRLEEFSRAAQLASAASQVFERELAPLDMRVTMLGRSKGEAFAEVQRLQQGDAEKLQTEMMAHRKTLDLYLAAAEEHPKVEIQFREAQRAQWEAEQEHRGIETTMEGYRQVIRELKGASERKRCPTCGQSLKVDTKGLSKKLEAVQATLKRTEPLLHTARGTWTVAGQQAGRLEGRVAQGRQARQLVDHALVAVEHLQRTLAEHEARLRRAAEKFEDLTRQEEEARQALNAVRARHWRAAWWAKGFGRDGLQASYFAAAGPILNEAAERVSARLTRNNIVVEFQPIRSSRLEDVIRLSGTSAPTVKGLSKGEKRRVSVIVAFALRALARWRQPVVANLMIFDEIFDGLDGAGLRGAAEILQEEMADGTSVLLITHDDNLKRYFPATRIISVIRQGGEATVEVS